MAKHGIALQTADSVIDEIDRLHQTISDRAYALSTTGRDGDPLANWLDAEREMVRKPEVELRRNDGHYDVLAATAGVRANDIDVKVTPDDLLITANAERRIFGSIHFPEKIDPNSVTAEYRDGLLHLTAAIAGPD